MIWAKRNFQWPEYTHYLRVLADLQLANPGLAEQFVMVSRKIEGPGISAYYIGLPNETFLKAFDNFAVIREQELPDVIDDLHLAAGDTVTKFFKILT